MLCTHHLLDGDGILFSVIRGNFVYHRYATEVRMLIFYEKVVSISNINVVLSCRLTGQLWKRCKLIFLLLILSFKRNTDSLQQANISNDGDRT